MGQFLSGAATSHRQHGSKRSGDRKDDHAAVWA